MDCFMLLKTNIEETDVGNFQINLDAKSHFILRFSLFLVFQVVADDLEP